MYTLFLGQESHSTSYAKLYYFQVEGLKADTHCLTYKVAYRNQAVRVVSYQLEVWKQSHKQSHLTSLTHWYLTVKCDFFFTKLCHVWLKIKQLYGYSFENKLISIFKETKSRLRWFAMLWKFSVHDLWFTKCHNRPIIKLCYRFSANITGKVLFRLGCQTNNNDLTSRSVP